MTSRKNVVHKDVQIRDTRQYDPAKITMKLQALKHLDPWKIIVCPRFRFGCPTLFSGDFKDKHDQL